MLWVGYMYRLFLLYCFLHSIWSLCIFTIVSTSVTTCTRIDLHSCVSPQAHWASVTGLALLGYWSSVCCLLRLTRLALLGYWYSVCCLLRPTLLRDQHYQYLKKGLHHLADAYAVCRLLPGKQLYTLWACMRTNYLSVFPTKHIIDDHILYIIIAIYLKMGLCHLSELISTTYLYSYKDS